MWLLFVAISPFLVNVMIQVILLRKLQALTQTLQNVPQMDNSAGTSFLRRSLSRFGVSGGFSVD